jgi:hypothetical protein
MPNAYAKQRAGNMQTKKDDADPGIDPLFSEPLGELPLDDYHRLLLPRP